MDPKTYLDNNKQTRLDELFEFLKFPSISAKSEHKQDMINCAEWLADKLNRIGIESKLMATGGYPVVYGEKIGRTSDITVLYYGHYDVQPPEPLELWGSSPFEPIIEDNKIVARGATDDKGQLWAHVSAIEAFATTETEFPINIKMLIEGEEESGAENLARFVRDNAELLKADIVVVSDSSQFGKNRPAVTYGLRGVNMAEVKIIGPNRDLHSGGFGGAIPNPINVLAKIIAQLHNDKGQVAITGFYDDVRPIADWEKSEYEKLPFNENEYLKDSGVKGLWGEEGYTTYERVWSRPTLDCNGITGGYQGEGGKTIIPSWASCKITTRLVPNQDPEDICKKLENYIRQICPDYVRCVIQTHIGAGAVEVSKEGPWLEAAGNAIREGFGIEPVFIKEGGSIPVVGSFKEVLGLDTLLLGWGQQDNNAHSPNEFISLDDFERGCYSSLALIYELAKVRR